MLDMVHDAVDIAAMSLSDLKQPSLLRRAKDQVHLIQKSLRPKGPGAGMRTDVVAHGKPVLFVHNPRAGGRSLEAFFNVQRLSHSYPSEVLAETHWLDSFIVTSVRHPIDRFFQAISEMFARRSVTRWSRNTVGASRN